MKILFTFLSLITSHAIFGQVINVVFSGAAGSETLIQTNPTTPTASVNGFPVGSLTVNATGCPVTPIFSLTGTSTIPSSIATNAAGTWTIVYPNGLFTGLNNTNNISLTVTCGGASAAYSGVFSNSLSNPGGGGSRSISVSHVLNDPATSDPVIIQAKTHLTNTYDRKNNRVYIVVGTGGEVLSKKPVNIDEDDEFFVYLIGPQNVVPTINITSNGVYNPLDLSQTTTPNPTGFDAQSSSTVPWVGKLFTFGPYTTTESGVTFQMIRNGTPPQTINASQSLTFPINKFYHVDYAVSVISTNLASPTYKVAPISASTTDKTVIETDEGKRAMITFNVIWYWKSTINKLFKKSYKDDPITRGRDRIKEPYFWDRINPSFGLSIDQGFRENYFIGGVFEFARGGNICVGGHYGKLNGLANKKFKLGEDVFTGTNDDIITTKEWEWGTYIGITLDTRIFNRVTSALGRQ